MSEEEEIKKVTTEKAKNPGRQEWGRILGKMTKERKLKPKEVEKQPSLVRFGYSLAILPFIAVIIGAIYFYSRKKNAYVQEYEKKFKTQNLNFLTSK